MNTRHKRVIHQVIDFRLGVVQTTVGFPEEDLVFAELDGKRVGLYFLTSYEDRPIARKLVLHELSAIVNDKHKFLCLVPIGDTGLKVALWELMDD